MVIYADVLFLINFIMNSLILFLTAWSSGLICHWPRILLAAALGSFYVIGEFYLQPHLPYLVLSRCSLSLLLVLVAFGRRKLASLLLLTGIFYIISFALGGAVAGWFFLCQTSGFSGWYDVSWTDLLGGAVIGFLTIAVLMRRISEKAVRRTTLYLVEIFYQGRSAKIRAILDTGNSLATLVARKPVIVVNYTQIKAILSSDVIAYLETTPPDQWLPNLCACQDMTWLKRSEVIPYRSVGRQSMLLGFRPDYIVVKANGKEFENRQVAVGIYHRSLSADQTYDALLHPSVIHEFTSKQEAKECVFLGQF